MSFGIRVFSKTGPSYDLDGNCTAMSIIGALASNVTTETGLYVPEGYDYHAHLSDPCGFDTYFSNEINSDVIYTSIAPVPYLDDRRQLCFKNGKYARDYFGSPSEVTVISDQQLILLAWPKPTKASGNGILFNGVNSFFQINQNTNFTNVVWKGDIEISSEGWMVKNIDPNLSYHNSFVFFYCEDPTLSIGRRWRDGDRGKMVYAPYDHNGYLSKRTIKVKAVVFGISSIKKSKYGLRIYKKNRVVYDSCNEVLINPVITSFEKYPLGQMQSIKGIRRPMVARGSVGARYFSTSNAGWFCDIGLRSNGYQLSTTEQIFYKTYWLDSDLKFSSFISEQPVMVLDAENYFNF